MITEKKIYRDFEHYKKCAENALYKHDIDNAMEAMKVSCVLAKNYYLCYADEELEDMCRKCSDLIFGERDKQNTNESGEKFIFYDTHTTDNIALTQQYLAALISWNVDFLYLTTRKLEGNKTKIIRETLENYKRASLSIIPENFSMVEKTVFIRNQLKQYGAKKAFIQTVSDDVAGVVAWGSVNGVETYYIDLSDHSFWLGTKTFDYYITFRSYGYNISIQHRGLKADQVLIQPFYPIKTCKEYKGIPEINSKSVKILSGGRLDKIYGKNDMYFRLVKEILEQNPSVEFYFCGGGAFGRIGQTSYIKKQIKKLDERFHLLGFRDDIIEVMRHMDIYIGTYPIGGGLMTQIAASEGVPIVQYASDGLSSSIHEFLKLDSKENFVFNNDLKGFFDRVNKLVRNSKYREEIGEIYKKTVLTKVDFNRQLKELVEHPEIDRNFMEYPVDCIRLRENQIDVENNCFHSYPRILIKSSYIRKKELFVFMKNVVRFVRYSDKKWLFYRLTNMNGI